MEDRRGSEPLRLAYMVDSLVTGGAERLVATFAKAAHGRSDIDLKIFVLSDRNTPFLEELLKAGVNVETFPGRSLVDPVRFLRVVAALRSWPAEFVHAHLITSTVVGGHAAALLGIPFATTIHNVKASTARVSKVRGYLYRRVLQRPTTTRIAVGQAVAEAAKVDTGERDCIVVPNAVSMDSEAPPDARAQTRAALGVETKKAVLAVGAIIGQKAYDDMLAAFENVAEQDAEAVLLIAGNAPEPDRLDRLEALTHTLGIADRVYFLGLRKDIPELLSAADVFLSSSHWEGAPVSLLEAMVNGLPCVMTDVGDNGRILGDSGSAIVPAGQPDMLAQALTAMLSDCEARRRAGEQARRRAVECYGVATWVETLLEIYERTAGRSGWRMPAPARELPIDGADVTS